MAELRVDRINTFYGLSHILFDVSLEVGRGELVVLLGRNGAGKTTTMVSIMGLNPPKSGSIEYRGQQISGLPPYRIARMGIGFVPEDRKIFPDLTVAANLDVAAGRTRSRRPDGL
jgi:branched-chain amino acid transport system ATP-binding protein